MGTVMWSKLNYGVDCAFVKKPAVGLFTDSWKFTDSLPDGQTLPLGSPYTEPPQGLIVSAYGSVSGYQTGKILATYYTETYDGVTMTNMLKTSYKAVHGDSGAPVWGGGAAVGMQSASALSNGQWVSGSYTICMPMFTVCARVSDTNFWLTTF